MIDLLLNALYTVAGIASGFIAAWLVAAVCIVAVVLLGGLRRG